MTKRTSSIDGTASHDQARRGRSRAAVGRAERRAARAPLADRLHDRRVGMAQDQRAPRQHVVDVAVAVGIAQVRPLATRDEERRAPHRLGTRARGCSPRPVSLAALARRDPPIALCSPFRVLEIGDSPATTVAERGLPAGRPLHPPGQPARGLFGVVGDDEVGAGAVDDGQASRAARCSSIQPSCAAALSGVLAAHLVGGDRQVDSDRAPADDVELRACAA